MINLPGEDDRQFPRTSLLRLPPTDSLQGKYRFDDPSKLGAFLTNSIALHPNGNSLGYMIGMSTFRSPDPSRDFVIVGANGVFTHAAALNSELRLQEDIDASLVAQAGVKAIHGQYLSKGYVNGDSKPSDLTEALNPNDVIITAGSFCPDPTKPSDVEVYQTARFITDSSPYSMNNIDFNQCVNSALAVPLGGSTWTTRLLMERFTLNGKVNWEGIKSSQKGEKQIRRIREGMDLAIEGAPENNILGLKQLANVTELLSKSINSQNPKVELSRFARGASHPQELQVLFPAMQMMQEMISKVSPDMVYCITQASLINLITNYYQYVLPNSSNWNTILLPVDSSTIAQEHLREVPHYYEKPTFIVAAVPNQL